MSAADDKRPVVLNVVDPEALKPGTKVLLSWTERLTKDVAQDLQRLLAERFPGVEFTIVAGRVEAVMPPGSEA